MHANNFIKQIGKWSTTHGVGEAEEKKGDRIRQLNGHVWSIDECMSCVYGEGGVVAETDASWKS